MGGMRVACVIIPHLQAKADESCDRKIFSQTVDGLATISDRIEAAAPGTVYVRLDGLEKLYGGEAQLLKALLGAVPQALQPRIGVADAKFPAFVAASSSHSGVTIVPADVPGFLAPYAVDLLPIPVEVRDGLERFGLHTMGAVAALQEGQFLDQFGLDGRRAWRLCRGVDDSPVMPLKREEPVVERLSLPFHTTSLNVLRAAIDTLLRRTWSHPRMRGRCPGRADLECTVSAAPPWTHTVHFKENVPGWERAAFIVNHRVERNPPHAPVEAVKLVLSDFTAAMGVQLSLLPNPREDREQPPAGGGALPALPHAGPSRAVPRGHGGPLASGAGKARPANPHRPGGQGRHQAPGAAGPGDGARRPGPTAAGGLPAAAMVPGGPHR